MSDAKLFSAIWPFAVRAKELGCVAADRVTRIKAWGATKRSRNQRLTRQASGEPPALPYKEPEYTGLAFDGAKGQAAHDETLHHQRQDDGYSNGDQHPRGDEAEINAANRV